MIIRSETSCFRANDGELSVPNLKLILDGREVTLGFDSANRGVSGSVRLSVRPLTEPWSRDILTLPDVPIEDAARMARELGLELVARPRPPESITDVIWGTDDCSVTWRTPASSRKEGDIKCQR